MINNKLIRLFFRIMRNTGAYKILGSYLLFIFVDAALIWVFEPTIDTYGDALWYCYAVLTTAGFGDLVVSAFIPKMLSVILSAYSIFVLAIVTGVVVNFYTQMIDSRNKETITAFFDQMERLPELSRDELEDLSDRVKHFRGNE